MPSNKYALLRYRIINNCLTNVDGDYPNKEDLRQACEDALYGSQGIHISDSTIEKDIFAMRNESQLGYYAPIKYSKVYQGYYYCEENYSIDNVSLNEYDLEAIKSATDVLKQFKGIPLFQQYESALNKIINRVNISSDPEDELIDKYMQFETMPLSIGDEYLSVILEAIKERRVIEMTYLKFQDDKKKKYTLAPYLLKEYRNRWYMIAYEKERNLFLTFGLERIKNIELISEYFSRKKDFDSDAFFKHSIGITQISSAPQEIILSFLPIQGKYILSQPLHHSQKLILQNDEEIRVQLKVYETYELIQIILGYGKGVKVLKPDSLRSSIVSSLQAGVIQYE